MAQAGLDNLILREYNDDMIGGLSPMNRATWKVCYRLLRIHRREWAKASIDMMLYGTGTVLITNDGNIQHVPFEGLAAHYNAKNDVSRIVPAFVSPSSRRGARSMPSRVIIPPQSRPRL